MSRRGWSTKRWTTKKGRQRGGRRFDKNSLYNLLTNIVYIGKIRYRNEIHKGQHAAIIEPETFEQVQNLLRLNYRTGGKRVRNRFGALLKGLLRCKPCGCAMTHSHTTKGGTKRYRYYVCTNAQKRGWANCPSKSVPAPEIERFVIDQIREIGRDPGIIAATLTEAREQSELQIAALEKERHDLVFQRERDDAELRAASLADGESTSLTRSADLLERIGLVQKRIDEIDEELATLRHAMIDENDVATGLADFNALWTSLSLREQARVIDLLIERVDYDGAEGTVSVTFRPSGIRVLTEGFAGEGDAA